MFPAGAMKTLSWLVPLIVLVSVTGCASSSNPQEGRKWVVEQQNERDRLESQGFPQHTGGS